MPTCEELASLFDQGLLPAAIARRFGLNDSVEIQMVEARCAELHNAGTVDFLRLVESNAVQDLEGTDFFVAMNFFCRILPELGATTARMMACVEALVSRAGDDLAANQPNAAFRDWCTKDPRRAHEVIAAARGGDDLASQHLTFALEALKAITLARQIALTHDGACRHSAITALGRIEDDDPASRVETFAAFRAVLDAGADDSLRAGILHATARILDRSGDAPSPEAIVLVRLLVEDPGEFTVHQCAHVLWACRRALQPDIVDCLLEALAGLNPANKGTVDELDLGLQSLLDAGFGEAAVDYVTKLLARQDDGVELDQFDSFTRTLLSSPAELLSRVVVQWLLLGSSRLRGGLAKAIGGPGTDDQPLDLRAEDLAVSPLAQMFICRKAIGWFFLKPTTAASVVVSVLRICDTETALELQKLLVETLLLNYSGVRDYLEGLAPDDAAKALVDQTLQENEAYLAALRAVPPAKEFQPSEHHRRVESLRMSGQMREVHRQAQKHSVLLSLVKRSVLLHGSRSLHFIEGGNGSLRPVEMDLMPFEVTIELPRMQTIDPVGLDYILRVFRTQSMRS